MAYKVFTNGSVLNASEINDNLMNQAVMVFSNSTARAAAITSPLEGMLTWLQDTNKYENYNGTAWVSLGGGILQVVSTAKTDTFVSSSIAAGVQVAVTGLSATITPSSTSSKILIQASVYVDAAEANLSAIMMRAGSALTGATGDAAGSRSRVTSSSSRAAAAGHMTTLPMMYLDSPATTSATTYSVNIMNATSTTGILYVNRTATDTNLSQFSRGMSSITLLEVAG